MSEQAAFRKLRIEILPGIFIVSDKYAGQGWIEAWHVLNTALKRCQTINPLPGDAQDDDDHNQHPR